MRIRHGFQILIILLCLFVSRAVVQSAAGNSITGTLVVRQGDTLVNGVFHELTPQIGVYDQNNTYHRLGISSGSPVKLAELVRLNNKRVTVDIGTQSPQQQSITVDSLQAVSAVSTQNQASLVGSQPWVNVLCSIPGSATPRPHPLAYYNTMYRPSFPSMDNFFRDISSGIIHDLGPTTRGWYALPYAINHYAVPNSPYPDLDMLMHDCTQAAEADVFFPNFAGINMFFDVDFQASFGGGAQLILDGVTRNYAVTWIHHSEDPFNFASHEDGHGYGLAHSCGDRATCDNYADYTTQMSGLALKCDVVRDPDFGCIPFRYDAFDLYSLGWLDPFVTTSEGYHEYNLQGLYETGSAPRAIIISLTPDTFITVEARKLASYDSKLVTEGVILHDVDLMQYPMQAFINVAGNGDNLSKQAFMTRAGQKYTDPSNRFSVCLKSISGGLYKMGIGVGVDCTNPPPPTSTPTPTRTPTVTPTPTRTPTPGPIDKTPTAVPTEPHRQVYIPVVIK